MAALDFPASPTTNQVYSANGKAWVWNGTVWVPKATLWGPSSIKSTTPITYDSSTATIGLGPVDGGTAQHGRIEYYG